MKLSLIIIFLLSYSLHAQDERFFRKIFSDDFIRKDSKEKSSPGRWQVTTPAYQYDIDSDGHSESIIVEKKDGEDWIHLYSLHGKHLFSAKLEPKGFDSYLYKISIRRISLRTKVLILHFYEGYHSYLDSIASARLYFLTIDSNNFNTLSLFKGPRFWQERRTNEGDYHRRNMKLSFFDYNGDGVKEISVKHQFINRVYYYQGRGRWRY